MPYCGAGVPLRAGSAYHNVSIARYFGQLLGVFRFAGGKRAEDSVDFYGSVRGILIEPYGELREYLLE
jgi:hypothetical protein